MSKGLQVTLLTIGGIVAVGALLLIGMIIGRAAVFSSNVWSHGFSVLRTDLDDPFRASMLDSPPLDFQYVDSMMVPGVMGTGMMGYAQAGVPYGSGMMGMMGGFAFSSDESMLEIMGEPAEGIDFTDLPVGPQEAVEVAQRYLDAYRPGTGVDDTPDPFYGYYTLHIERDGKVVGMLSVNGTTGQVWPHTWHSDLLEMSDHE